MTDTERTFGVPVLKKSLIGQRIQDKWKGRQLNLRFRETECYPDVYIPYDSDDIPVIERINTELEKNGSHS